MTEQELKKIFDETQKELMAFEEIKKITSGIKADENDITVILTTLTLRMNQAFLFRVLSKILCKESELNG